MEIIAVRPDDIQELIEIQTECSLSTWTRDGYLAEIKRPDSVILAARDPDNGIVGFIAGRVPEGEDDRMTDAEIYNIGTRPRFRKQGVGSTLLRGFIDLCTDRGVGTIWLEVRTGNHTGIRFYTSHGFAPVSVRRNFYSAPVEDAQVMALRLKYDPL